MKEKLIASLIVAAIAAIFWALFYWFGHPALKVFGLIVPLALVPIWIMEDAYWSREDYDGGH